MVLDLLLEEDDEVRIRNFLGNHHSLLPLRCALALLKLWLATRNSKLKVGVQFRVQNLFLVEQIVEEDRPLLIDAFSVKMLKKFQEILPFEMHFRTEIHLTILGYFKGIHIDNRLEGVTELGYGRDGKNGSVGDRQWAVVHEGAV